MEERHRNRREEELGRERGGKQWHSRSSGKDCNRRRGRRRESKERLKKKKTRLPANKKGEGCSHKKDDEKMD